MTPQDLHERNLIKMRESWQAHKDAIAAMSPEDRAEHDREKARRQEALGELFRLGQDWELV